MVRLDPATVLDFSRFACLRVTHPVAVSTPVVLANDLDVLRRLVQEKHV